MAKSKRNISLAEDLPTKRARLAAPFNPIKIATAAAAAAVDGNTPFSQLTKLLSESVKAPQKGSSIAFWMRMGDLRIKDNRALSRASEQAQTQGLPVVGLFVISPQDYTAHDTSFRRIDFMLRNLQILKKAFSELHIPLHIISQSLRKDVPSSVLSFCEVYGARTLYANIEYEVDELRRDIKVYRLGLERGIQVHYEHDKCLVDPGVLVTKKGKAYAVYSPYQRNWLATLNTNIPYYLEDCLIPKANKESIRSSGPFSSLFDTPIPTLNGFELEEDRNTMRKVWPEGEDAAAHILDRFLKTKSRHSQVGAVDPLSAGSEICAKHNRIANYEHARDRVDSDTTSRLSAYLTSGVISVRACARATMFMLGSNKIESNKTSGIGRWLQELAWRDFYVNILVFCPRVSMGRPYLEQYSEVVWENHQVPQDSGQGRAVIDEDDGEILKRWKVGMTGVPIVDASMRCINEMGWVHNRARMITAMYLTKDLMIDWRLGERYFMEKLIDGDLASNNGGWQWCASTGADPCPYFRIFNPYTQSLKVDPTGNFIKHWIPELRKLNGPDLHNPSTSLADKLGYPRPIISHNEARVRALRRYKNPGEE